MSAVQFKVGESVVYPSHGVGEITAIESQFICGSEIKVYVVSFPQDKMTLKVPVSRASVSGLRTISQKGEISKIYETLKGKPKPGNKMWSRKAKDYEAKINSGNVLFIAEVLRDLYKDAEVDRSFSERRLYETALDRLSTELAVLESINPDQAAQKLIEALKGRSVAA